MNTSEPRRSKRALPARKLRVLVVDDNRDAAITLGVLVRLMGHETETANDGAEALARARVFHPDVVILDIGLPSMSGYEAARQFRLQPGGTQLVLIAITGWGHASDKQRSDEAGFDHHLVKPVDPELLTSLFQSLEQTVASGRGSSGGP